MALGIETSDGRQRGDHSDIAKKIAPQATGLLRQDHREAMALFQWYENFARAASKPPVLNRLCMALKLHMQVEEEIFYPAAAAEDHKLIDKAVDEHLQAKLLIGRLESVGSTDDPDRLVRELKAVIEQHVLSEEGTLFPELQTSSLDLLDLGRQMAERKLLQLRGLTKKEAQRGKKEGVQRPSIDQ